jgi:hypothetical protein
LRTAESAFAAALTRKTSEIRSAFSRKYTPFAGDTLERLNAAVTETQPGAGDQVLYGARYKNLACTGKRRNARADVNGDAADIISDHLAFAGMEPGTNLDTERLDFLGNRTRAANPASRTVKGSEKAVARRFDFMAAKARKIAADRGVMLVEEIAPPLVAERGGPLGGADDVGEEYGSDRLRPAPANRSRIPRSRQRFRWCSRRRRRDDRPPEAIANNFD